MSSVWCAFWECVCNGRWIDASAFWKSIQASGSDLFGARGSPGFGDVSRCKSCFSAGSRTTYNRHESTDILVYQSWRSGAVTMCAETTVTPSDSLVGIISLANAYSRPQVLTSEEYCNSTLTHGTSSVSVPLERRQIMNIPRRCLTNRTTKRSHTVTINVMQSTPRLHCPAHQHHRQLY